jgi:hypothetical protein
MLARKVNLIYLKMTSPQENNSEFGALRWISATPMSARYLFPFDL